MNDVLREMEENIQSHVIKPKQNILFSCTKV